MLEVPVRLETSAVERRWRVLADDSRRRVLMELLDALDFPAELARRLEWGKANTSDHSSC